MHTYAYFWVEHLPTVLLGIRSGIKDDIGASTAELVYGISLSLPGDLFRNSTDSHVYTRIEFSGAT